MAKLKLDEKGETFRPSVTVHKSRYGVPTDIEFSGYKYALVHEQNNKGKDKTPNKKPRSLHIM